MPFPSRAGMSLLTVVVALLGAGWLFAGPLTPPAGPVASTGKTLVEVEPRTAVSAANTPGNASSAFRITQPGSYYLLGNVVATVGKSGVVIAASGVTLDLNGFEIGGINGSLSGVSVETGGFRRIMVRNGTIRGCGVRGVNLQPASTTSVQDVIATENGADGIVVGASGNVENCSATFNGGNGILTGEDSVVRGCIGSRNSESGVALGMGSTISGCNAGNNTRVGLSLGSRCVVNDCNAWSNGDSGIFTNSYCAVNRCGVTGNSQSGISAYDDCTVSGCNVSNNSTDGVRVSSRCLVAGNTCSFNGLFSGDGAGILALQNDNRIEGNTCTSADRGIQVEGNRNRVDGNSVNSNGVGVDVNGADNIVVRNTASGNSPNYSIVAGNCVAPRVSVADSDGWAGITNGNHPWANFGY